MAKEFLLRDGVLSLGGITFPHVAKSANYSILETDYFIDCTSGTFTVTLPTAVGVHGKIYIVKNSGSGAITLATTSSQTIDGSLTKIISQYKSFQIQSNGSNWVITNRDINYTFSDTAPNLPADGDYWLDSSTGIFYVYVVDENSSQWVQFVGAKGEQGFQGAGFQGSQGNQGEQGVQGVQGFQGRQGFQGNQGDQGFQGKQGSIGNQGVIGEQGFQGNQGFIGNQGFQGDQGNQGDQGFYGDKGEQGVQGDQGFQGEVPFTYTGIWSVLTTYVSNNAVTYQGSLYQLTNIGIWSLGSSPPNNGWELLVSKGDQGDQGFQGNQGDQGFQGLKGDQGFQGLKGDQGNQGLKGEQGYQGYQGYLGLQGSQGVQGRQGIIGNQGDQGYQGLKGDQGFQGNQGRQGYQGIIGQQGEQGEQGHQGNRGNQGYMGYQGSQGFQGVQGDQGDQGVQGSIGDQGYQGRQGITGNQGQQGRQGDQGEQGYQGFQGFQGDRGNQGYQGIQGFQGYQGYQGQTGSGVSIKGSETWENIFNIKTSGATLGDVWVLTSTAQGTAAYPCPNPSGGSATIGNGLIYTGSSPVYWQNVGSIRGPQGYQGIIGNQGFQGNQGNQGDQGVFGNQGDQGFQGIQGDQGTMGYQGRQGNQGIQGSIGDQGYQGRQGFQGTTGSTGAQGFQGFQGITGSQGLQGFQGYFGNQGYQGTAGNTGSQGSSGSNGSQGYQGYQGIIGVQGSQGFQSSGSVTSVSLSVPAIFSISGSPVTTAGGFTVTLVNQSANTVLASPNGSAGVPSFRTLVAADIPNPLNQDTTGVATTAINISGGAAGQIAYQTGVGSTAMLAAGTSGQILKSNGSSPPAWINQSAITAGGLSTTLTVGSGGTGLTSAGTSGNVLTSDGTNWKSSAPVTQQPTGSIIAFAGSTAPAGWLLCDGTNYNKSSYETLYATIGIAFGGTINVNFNVPDARGRTIIGVGTGVSLTTRGLAATTGTETVTLASSQIPSHTHGFTPSGYLNNESSHTHGSANAGWHNHSSSLPGLCYVGSGGGGNLSAGNTFQNYYMQSVMYGSGDHNHGPTNSNSGHTHSFYGYSGSTDGGTGGGASHSNMQPSIALNYIIKT